MISVVIPVYNREKTVKQSVESVLNQTVSDIEVIIVDDASKDNSVKIVKEIQDNRVKIIELEENKGACVARNIGIKEARGEYIAFHDSDDLWVNDKLEISLKVLKEKKADVVFTAFCRKYLSGRTEKLPKYDLNQYENKVREILWDNPITTPTLFGKSEVFKTLCFDEEMPRFQDWDIGIRIAEKYKIYYIDSELTISNIQDNSLTMNPEKAIVALERMHKKYPLYYENDKKLQAKYYKLLAEFEERANINGKENFKKSYKLVKNKNTLIKYWLSAVGIYKIVLKIRSR